MSVYRKGLLKLLLDRGKKAAKNLDLLVAPELLRREAAVRVQTVHTREHGWKKSD
jgi:hypothetical protein